MVNYYVVIIFLIVWHVNHDLSYQIQDIHPSIGGKKKCFVN